MKRVDTREYKNRRGKISWNIGCENLRYRGILEESRENIVQREFNDRNQPSRFFITYPKFSPQVSPRRHMDIEPLKPN